MAPLAVLWCVSPACPTPNSPRERVDRPRARRERSVYTDEASSSLLAFTGHEAPAGGHVAFPSLPSTETLESLATFDGRRSPSAFTAVSAGRASPAVAEPAPPTPPKEREKRDSLLCDGDTVDAVLGSVFD